MGDGFNFTYRQFRRQEDFASTSLHAIRVSIRWNGRSPAIARQSRQQLKVNTPLFRQRGCR